MFTPHTPPSCSGLESCSSPYLTSLPHHTHMISSISFKIQMDSSSSQQQQRNKKKHVPPPSLFLYFSFFLFLFFFFFISSSHHSFSSFHPSLPISSTFPLFYTSKPNSLLLSSSTTTTPFSLQLQDRIIFPDHVLLTLSNPHHLLPDHHQLLCLYHNASHQLNRPVLSTDRYDELRSIARCPLPPENFSAISLRWRGDSGLRSFESPVYNWDKLAYEAILDGDTAVVFVKGLNLRPHRLTDPTRFRCHFGFHRNGTFWLTTKAVSVAQEVVRCTLPQSIRNNPNKARGMKVTVSHVTGHVRREPIPSVARIGGYRRTKNGGSKFELCACTMVWNQARAIREWVTYHAWLGVERWYIYDNNSEDDLKEVVEELNLKGYNISREVWPWIKSQEAGFSHCGLRAREDCNWVGFFDVDEFFYFSKDSRQNSLRSYVANFSSSKTIAEIRTACHSFGPSGIDSPPKQGVTVGYTCRLQSPERHKSIVRPGLIHESLLNVVHHFELKEGFGYRDLPRGSGVINHYKYQVWEKFKDKFFRRVATYVADWQEEQNKGSKDRAPGLGTQAIEPPNWRLMFCEVWDTGLKDLILSNFADPATGLLPWEKYVE